MISAYARNTAAVAASVRTRRAPSVIAASCLALLLGACAQQSQMTSTAAQPQQGALTPTGPAAVAKLMTPAGAPAGQAILTPVKGGVDVQVAAHGLTPGMHGMHVHAHGACAPGPDAATGAVVDFGAAGGHFDPGASHNHGRPGQPAHVAHAGELPALQAGADGRATLRYLNSNLTLDRAKTSAMGRTLVVHADADDYQSDPAGNSGARVLCGLIEPAAGGIVQSRATLEGSQVFPEGIAVDPRSGTAYVGSTQNGDIFKIEPGAPKAELFQAGGSPGRMGAFGMKIDPQGRLWVAGGPNGSVSVIDTRGGATLAVYELPPKGPQPFINDLTISSDGHVYATDSFHPVIYRIRNTPAGVPTALEPWLNLSASPIRYLPNQINLNGIVASPDGRWLLSVQLATGQLWRVDTRARTVSEVALPAGALMNGDGLVLAGSNDLLVMRNEENEIVHLRLADSWANAEIVQRHTDARLKYPTTAALSADGLYVVNAQLNKQKSPPALLPFDVVKVRVPGL